MLKYKLKYIFYIFPSQLAALAQMVACLPLIQQIRGSFPGGEVNFNLKIFNLGARRVGDVHFLMLDCTRTLINNIYPTSTFTPVRSADSSHRDCVVREMQTAKDILGKPV